MATKAILELYNRFVKDMDDQLVLVDDTDSGIDTTDHTDSPWMNSALNDIFMQDRYTESGTVITVPLSRHGPTLIIYWLCEMPKVEIREGVGIDIVMPYGRVAVLYYLSDELIEMKSYFAK